MAEKKKKEIEKLKLKKMVSMVSMVSIHKVIKNIIPATNVGVTWNHCLHNPAYFSGN